MKKVVCILIVVLTFGITYGGAIGEETAYSLSAEDKLFYYCIDFKGDWPEIINKQMQLLFEGAIVNSGVYVEQADNDGKQNIYTLAVISKQSNPVLVIVCKDGDCWKTISQMDTFVDREEPFLITMRSYESQQANMSKVYEPAIYFESENYLFYVAENELDFIAYERVLEADLDDIDGTLRIIIRNDQISAFQITEKDNILLFSGQTEKDFCMEKITMSTFPASLLDVYQAAEPNG